MTDAHPPHTSPTTQWTAWPGSMPPAAHDSLRLSEYRRHAFRLLAVCGSIALFLVVVRGLVLQNSVEWADLFGALLLLAAYWTVRRLPRWLPFLTWIVLAALCLDVLDSLPLWLGDPITPTHLLMPLLVLYGALLGDLFISVLAMAFVLGCFAYTWGINAPLDTGDMVRLTNLCIATVVMGLACLTVWFQRQRLIRALDAQAHSLQRELEWRLRLNAVIRHDIRNPLGGLLGTTQLARAVGKASEDDIDTIGRMAGRIAEIVDSISSIDADAQKDVPTSVVSVGTLWAELHDLLAHRLAEKEQSFVMTLGTELMVETNRQLLCNSVLSNVLSNAIKFSPRGEQIEMRAAREGRMVRIQLRDHGEGFAPQMFAAAQQHTPPASRLGTEGERGTGRGLQIAALYLRRLSGTLEFRNLDDSGAAVAVILPAATEAGT